MALSARVRIKKCDGKSNFTDTEMRWYPDPVSAEVNGNSAQPKAQPLLVPWVSVQDQQVSSLTSPKAMIRLRLTNNVVIIMEFLSDKGLEDAFEIRDQAKEIIARSLAVHQRDKPTDRTPLCNPAEIKFRAALLAANTTLKRQHMEMVGGGLIAEEDFWSSRRHLIANEASKRQKTGKTSAILTDLAGDTESGGNTVKYNLTAEVIHQIFVQYPAVKLAFHAQVPDKMSEKEFWGALLKSKYFHRDRKAGHEDLFSKYEEKEKELEREKAKKPRGVDPLIDLTATEEDAVIHKSGDKPLRAAKGSELMKMTIAKFNRHSAYVLEPTQAGIITATIESSKKTRFTGHDTIKDATLLDDLQGKSPPVYNPLTIEDESMYFQHMENLESTTTSTATASMEESCEMFYNSSRLPFNLDRAFPTSKVALDVLSEMVASADSSHDASASSAASLMSGSMAADCIPIEFKKQVYAQFHDVCELLRHFLSFRAKVKRGGDPDAKHKLARIVKRMGDKYEELLEIRAKMPPHQKNLLAPLLKPFDDQLNIAFIE